MELTPAGGTRAEGGDTGLAPTYDPISGTRGLLQTHPRGSHQPQRHKVAASLRAGRGHTRNTGAIYPDSLQGHPHAVTPQTGQQTDALSYCHTSAGNWGTHTRAHTPLSFPNPPPPAKMRPAAPPRGSCWLREVLHGDQHRWSPPSEQSHSRPVREAELSEAGGVYSILG